MKSTGKKKKVITPILSEEYVVKFWFQKEDGLWEQREESYFFEDKHEHEKAEKLWRNAHKNDKVKFISVVYV